MSKSNLYLTLFLLSFGLNIWSFGCSKAEKSVPTGTVKGIATLEGMPLTEGSRIQFASKEGVLIGLATVTTGGQYSVTYNATPNLPAGEYTVQVLPPEDVKQLEEDNAKRKAALIDSISKKAKPVIPPYTQEEQVPLKYWSTGTSQLKVTIEAGENTTNFELKKK